MSRLHTKCCNLKLFRANYAVLTAFILSGQGVIWRKLHGKEEITLLSAGTSIDIP